MSKPQTEQSLSSPSEQNHCVSERNSNLGSIWKRKTTEVLFLGSVAGMSILFGFGLTLSLAKKKDPEYFNKGLIGSTGIPESGSALAMRALGRGTLYAVCGCSLLGFVIWKATGAHSMQEFTAKVQSTMPTVAKHEPTGKSDFKTVRELVDYVLEEDKRKKQKKDS